MNKHLTLTMHNTHTLCSTFHYALIILFFSIVSIIVLMKISTSLTFLCNCMKLSLPYQIIIAI